MLRNELIRLSIENLRKMGLQVLRASLDYRGDKPDLVVIYPDKGKYYLVEVIAEDCLSSPSPRLINKGRNADSREFCRKLYPDERTAAWAAGIYCDLGRGIELFAYKELAGANFSHMNKYAALIYPSAVSKEADKVLTFFKLQFRALDVLGIFTLTLLSQPDTAKLSEARRFMQFLVANRDM